MAEPRKARVSVRYIGKNISSQIETDIRCFTYNDEVSGQSDTISIDLQDVEKKWMSIWMPSKGDRITAKILFYNWDADNTKETLACGNFEVDELSFSGRPLTCSIGAIAIPQGEAFHNRNRTKTWEKITIKQIATEIAKNAGVELSYEGDAIPIESMEQNNENDCKFLYSVCETYGFAMKVYSKKIVIFEEEIYEKKKAVATIHEKDMIAWEYNTSIAGTYTGANVSFSDPDNNKEYHVKIGNGKRILEVNVTADNAKDAERKGTAKLNQENKKATTMHITIKANPIIIASACVNITGLKKLNGKYYVDRVTTSVSGEGACQMQLDLRFVERMQSESAKAADSAKEGNTQYKIVAGDTLWTLAKKHYGNGSFYTKIYEANKEIIESAARARGKANSKNGYSIYPGTIITIPR